MIYRRDTNTRERDYADVLISPRSTPSRLRRDLEQTDAHRGTQLLSLGLDTLPAAG